MTHPPSLKTARFHPLPGTAVGILAGDARKEMAEEGRSGPPDALCFSSGGGSYRWFYVVDPKKPLVGALSVRVGEMGETTHRFEALSMATSRTLKDRGITALYTLVKVEVNGGMGSPATDRFVATKLEILEGTAGYPIRVAAVVDKLKDEARKTLDGPDLRAAIEAEMRAAGKQAVGDRKPTRKRETAETIHVTWEPRSERLVAEIRTRIAEGVLQPGIGAEYVGPGQPGGEASPPPQPQQGTMHGKLFGVETSVVFEVDKTGTEVSRQVSRPRPFTEDLPPPQVQGGVVPSPSRPD